MTLILYIIILGATILVHEFGHYLFARLTGVHIYEFSLGMGPTIYSKNSKKTDTKYSIRAIPVGGFVQLAGEEIEIEKTRKKYPGKCLQDKSLLQRFLILFFGAGFNFIFAIILLFLIGLIFGSKNLDPVISQVEVNTPAYVAGIQNGDKILSINNKRVKYLDDIPLYLNILPRDKSVTFKILKTDETIKEYSIKAEKKTTDNGDSYIYGIGITQKYEKGILKAFKFSLLQTCAYFKQMFVALFNLFTGNISIKQLSGPVGIYTVVGEARGYGILSILMLVTFLSINVGVINLIPFPAFDGGRILFLVIEKIKGSPINPKAENIIHSIGFILLLLLIVYVTFNDIFRISG